MSHNWIKGHFFHIMKADYSKQYKDPRWQKKRLEILQRDDFKCCYCGNKEKTLHVHHKVYEKGSDIWDYPDNLLITLCEDCHNWEHYEQNELYNTFKEIKSHWIELGLSMTLLNSFLGIISSCFENIKTNEDYLTDEKVLQLIYDTLCGVQTHSDIIALGKIIDTSQLKEMFIK